MDQYKARLRSVNLNPEHRNPEWMIQLVKMYKLHAFDKTSEEIRNSLHLKCMDGKVGEFYLLMQLFANIRAAIEVFYEWETDQNDISELLYGLEHVMITHIERLAEENLAVDWSQLVKWAENYKEKQLRRDEELEKELKEQLERKKAEKRLEKIKQNSWKALQLAAVAAFLYEILS